MERRTLDDGPVGSPGTVREEDASNRLERMYQLDGAGAGTGSAAPAWSDHAQEPPPRERRPRAMSMADAYLAFRTFLASQDPDVTRGTRS